MLQKLSYGQERGKGVRTVANKTFRSHYATVHDRRTVRTREALGAALLQLLQEKPLERITVRDIAGAAGIAYPTFFRHYLTKETLLQEVVAEEVSQAIALVLPALDSGNTREASLALCAHIDQRRKLWCTLLTGGAAAMIRDEFLRLAGKAAAVRTPPGAWLPTDLSVILNVGGTIDLLTWWLRQACPASVAYVAEVHERIVVTPTVRANQLRVTPGRVARSRRKAA